MGSFDYTCCISNLPIKSGDEIRYILLTQNPYTKPNQNTCYSTDRWFNRTFPIRAVYNDYGSIENIKDDFLVKAIVECFNRDLIETVSNSKYDEPVKKNMSFGKMLDSIFRGNVFVTDKYNEKQLPVAQAMIREDVWKSICNITLSSDEYKNISTCNIFKQEARKCLDLFNEHESFWNKIINSDKTIHQYIFANSNNNIIISNLQEIPISIGLMTHFFHILKSGINENQIEYFLDMVAEFCFINTVLDVSRYQWNPTGGVGPQFGEWDIHRLFHLEMAKIATKELEKEQKQL
jgi:hypothetical protein